MVLIADGGSTKTEWCLTKDGKVLQHVITKGMNPYFQTEEDIGEEIAAALLPGLKSAPFDALYFYGAGCTLEKIPMMQRALKKYLEVETIEVNSDILGAARGLCRRTAGIVCILGTGSNSCFYDGETIVSNVSPLGFILGDEGGGAVLGKMMVGDLLKNQLPSGLKEKFLNQFDLTPASIIERVYRQPFPNRFLASLQPFLEQNIDVPQIRTLIVNAFKQFLNRNVKQYDYTNNKLHFVGSIAYIYRKILQQAVDDCGMLTGSIVRSPMEGLVEYHCNHNTAL